MLSKLLNITLSRAKEWYKSDNAELKQLALETFSESELNGPHPSEITTYEEAKRAYYESLTKDSVITNTGIEVDIAEQLRAIHRIKIICKALNGDWKPNLMKDEIYYPEVKFYRANQLPSLYKDRNKTYFTYNGTEYVLINLGYHSFNAKSIFMLEKTNAICNADSSLFACRTPEIAAHMAKHFAKEIFLACYAGITQGSLEWK